MRKKKKQAQAKLLQQKQQQQQQAPGVTTGAATAAQAQPPKRPPARPTAGPAMLMMTKRGSTDSDSDNQQSRETKETTSEAPEAPEVLVENTDSPSHPSSIRGRYTAAARGGKKVTPGTTGNRSASTSQSKPVPGRGAASFSRQNYSPGAKPLSRTNYTPRGSLQGDDDSSSARGSLQGDEAYSYEPEPEPISVAQMKPRPGMNAAAHGRGGGASGRPGPKLQPPTAPGRAPTMKITVQAPPPRVRNGPPSLAELMEIISSEDPVPLFRDPVRIGSGYVNKV